jgi:hypothetical protein
VFDFPGRRAAGSSGGVAWDGVRCLYAPVPGISVFGRLGRTEGCSLGMGGRGLALRCGGEEDDDVREDGNEAGGSANCSEFG